MTPTATPPTTAQGMTAEELERVRDFVLKDGQGLNEHWARKALDHISTQAATIAVLVEAAEGVYAESAGPANDGKEHRCHGCGVDLSMRGMAAEATEHDERCHFGKLAKAVANLPASAKALTDELEGLRARVKELEPK